MIKKINHQNDLIYFKKIYNKWVALIGKERWRFYQRQIDHNSHHDRNILRTKDGNRKATKGFPGCYGYHETCWWKSEWWWWSPPGTHAQTLLLELTGLDTSVFIPVMIGQKSMTSFKLVSGYFTVQITSLVFCCAGLVMPTGQTFAICGIWLYLKDLVVVQFVMLLFEV